MKGENIVSSRKWHSWVIKRNRFSNVIQFLQANVSEVDKYFYPFIKKEYQTKRGSRIKDRPLYEGYLFLRYEDSPALYHKIGSCPFITTYAGMVNDDEMERMQSAQGKLLTEVKANRFSLGEQVRLLSGPFKGVEGRVSRIEGATLGVIISLKILGRDNLEMVFPEDHLEKRTTLENSEVQDLGV